jgi:hypothetical protein
LWVIFGIVPVVMRAAISTVERSAKWPQFRLRTLMIAVTGCCVLFALMREVGPLASTGLCFFLLLVLLHVAGNALGTSLRDRAVQEPNEQQTGLSIAAPVAAQVANTPSRLREHTSLGRMIVILTAVGAALGGSLSSLAYAYWTDVHVGGLIVGSLSAAIVGGFFGFMTSSFCKMIFRAWRQALET